MQAFVALVHSEVNQSAWCQQEIGWATEQVQRLLDGLVRMDATLQALARLKHSFGAADEPASTPGLRAVR